MTGTERTLRGEGFAFFRWHSLTWADLRKPGIDPCTGINCEFSGCNIARFWKEHCR